MKHKITFTKTDYKIHCYKSNDGIFWHIEYDYVDKGWQIILLVPQEKSKYLVPINMGWFTELNEAKNFVRLIENANLKKRSNLAYRTKYVGPYYEARVDV